MPMSDVFQYVRAQYEEKPCPSEETGPGHRKALARNKEWFITELPEKWLVDYERRKKHHNTGYFAYNYLPYKTFANLKHTDVYDLLGEHLGISVNKQFAFMSVQNYSRNQGQTTQLHEDSQSTSNELLNTIVVVCDGTSKIRQSLPLSRNAGLSSIRTALSSDERLVRDTAAGKSFRESLMIEEKRGRYLQNMRAAKPVSDSSGTPVFVHNPSNFLSPMVFTASSKTCFILPTTTTPTATGVANEDQRRKSECKGKTFKTNESRGEEECISGENEEQKASKSVGPNLYVALAAAHFKLHHGNNHPSEQRTKKKHDIRTQQKRLCLAKLKSVYGILCCLHNIKTKDLRSREPLSYATIKAIAVKPLHSLNKDYHTHHHHHVIADLHHHHSPTPHNRLTSHNHNSTEVFHHHPQRPTHSNLHHHNKHHGHGLRHVKLQPQIETWEEVLELHRLDDKGGVKHPSETNSNPNIHGQVHHTPHLKSQRVLPPWQRQLVFVDNKDESLKKDPAQRLCECIESFHHFKSETSQQIKTALSDRKSQMEKHLSNKLAFLNLGADTNECLEEMREGAYRVKRLERAEESRKPTWYVLLEDEVKKVFGDGSRDRAGVSILEKLKPFIFTDNNTLPHVTEKFCLLVMSLPVYQLAIQPVISAMELVLEHVLNLPPTLFSKLREMRDLPDVTSELASPAYVFGMLV